MKPEKYLIKQGAAYFLKDGKLHIAPLNKADNFYPSDGEAAYATDNLPQKEIDAIVALLNPLDEEEKIVQGILDGFKDLEAKLRSADNILLTDKALVFLDAALADVRLWVRHEQDEYGRYKNIDL